MFYGNLNVKLNDKIVNINMNKRKRIIKPLRKDMNSLITINMRWFDIKKIIKLILFYQFINIY